MYRQSIQFLDDESSEALHRQIPFFAFTIGNILVGITFHLNETDGSAHGKTRKSANGSARICCLSSLFFFFRFIFAVQNRCHIRNPTYSHKRKIKIVGRNVSARRRNQMASSR